MLKYFTVNTTSEFICFIIALLCLIKDKNLIWRSMIIYLFITCLTEFSGKYIWLHHENNNWVYNIFLLCESGFTSLMFINLFSKYTDSRPMVLNGLALFLVCYASETAHQGFFNYNSLTFGFQSVQFVLYGLYFYYLLLKDDAVIRFKYSPDFWWVCGVLFFYFGNTACNLFYHQLDSIRIYGNEQLINFIFKVLNVILYGCWGYSFLCRRWSTKKSKA